MHACMHRCIYLSVCESDFLSVCLCLSVCHYDINTAYQLQISSVWRVAMWYQCVLSRQLVSAVSCSHESHVKCSLDKLFDASVCD